MHWLGRAPNPACHTQRRCQSEGVAPRRPHAPRLAFPDGGALTLMWFVLCRCIQKADHQARALQCMALVSLRTFSTAQISIRCGLHARRCVMKLTRTLDELARILETFLLWKQEYLGSGVSFGSRNLYIKHLLWVWLIPSNSRS